jgi:hypothetical protein
MIRSTGIYSVENRFLSSLHNLFTKRLLEMAAVDGSAIPAQ